MPLALCEPGARRTQDREVPSERALAELWQNAHALSDGLVTEDGRRMKVLYPGRPSARAGPDFRDAVISTESGEVIVGDVELHLRAPDWYAHGHHLDANYNGVVLHVVLRPGGRTTTGQRSGTRASVLSLAPELERLAGAGRPVPWKDLLDDGALLDEAGDRRFFDKVHGFAVEMRDCDPEQVLYAAMLEALGFASNRRPFRTLAARVPFRSLRRLASEPGGTRLLAVEALLLGASGLLKNVPARSRTQLRALGALLPRPRPMAASDWKTHRVRPSNHPVNRVRGAARLVDRYLSTGLATGMARALEAGGAGLVRGLTASPFVGNARAGDIAVNVVLPYLYAVSRPERRERCVEAYRAFPSLSGNELTREMTRVMGIDPSAVRGARRQQGLISLYRRHAGGGL